MLINAMPHTPTLQTLIRTGKRHHEISRLRATGTAHSKSDKSDAYPLAEKPCRDQRAVAPWRDLRQRKGSPQLQGELLLQGIRVVANLPPEFHNLLRLTPQVRHTPPSLQVVKQRLDAPTLRVDFHHGLSREFRFSRQNPSRPRPCVVVLAHSLHTVRTGTPFRNRATAMTERSMACLQLSAGSISCVGGESSTAVSIRFPYLRVGPRRLVSGFGGGERRIPPYLLRSSDAFGIGKAASI